MQQPYLSSPPESGGAPQRPAQVSSQHADGIFRGVRLLHLLPPLQLL